MLDKIGINPTSFLAQIVNFGLVFFVLTKLIYKPLLRLFDERAKKISQSLKAAEESLREKEKLETRKKEELKKTLQEMEKLLIQAKTEAKATGEEIVIQAREAAKKEAGKEYEKLAQKLREQEKQIKADAAKMVVALTRKTLEQTLDQVSQQKIFKAQLTKLKNMKME